MDAEVAAVLEAALEKNGPPPMPPVGDVQTRRVTLDAMLRYFNNQAQPIADDVTITTTKSPRQMVPRCWPDGTGGRRMPPAPPYCTCTPAG